MPENFHALYDVSSDERRSAAQEASRPRRLAAELPAVNVEVVEP